METNDEILEFDFVEFRNAALRLGRVEEDYWDKCRLERDYTEPERIRVERVKNEEMAFEQLNRLDIEGLIRLEEDLLAEKTKLLKTIPEQNRHKLSRAVCIADNLRRSRIREIAKKALLEEEGVDWNKIEVKRPSNVLVPPGEDRMIDGVKCVWLSAEARSIEDLHALRVNFEERVPKNIIVTEAMNVNSRGVIFRAEIYIPLDYLMGKEGLGNQGEKMKESGNKGDEVKEVANRTRGDIKEGWERIL